MGLCLVWCSFYRGKSVGGGQYAESDFGRRGLFLSVEHPRDFRTEKEGRERVVSDEPKAQGRI